MTEERIKLTIDGLVARVTFDHAPTMNAISPGIVEQISEFLPEAEKQARVLVVTGANGNFSSGADLSANRPMGQTNVDVGLRLETHFNPLMMAFRNLTIPWISAVPGAAAGVGCSIALSADLIVASKNAYFLQAFRRIGLIPDGGSAFVLSRAAGRVRAMEMMLLGDKIPATTALEWGLINRCVEPDALEAEVESIAEKLASGPTAALAMTRKSAWAAVEQDYENALAVERRLQFEAGNTQDFAEGVKAFREKRNAQFTGR